MMQPHNAQLTWAEGIPFSESFGDYYSSLNDGIAECHHVFIEGNQITQRTAQACATGLTIAESGLTIAESGLTIAESGLTIAESGFGTGINLLCTLTLLNKLSTTPRYGIHFISTELYPMTYDDLQKVLSAQPQLSHFAKQLLSQYPPVIKGMHRFIFDKGRFYLTLCIGDTAQSLVRITSPVDAWYLDGFSPAKNPDMWSTPLFQQMARLSKPGTTLATYTAASFVRKGLIEQGFSITKKPGFGKKRDMLTGQFTAAPATSSVAPLTATTTAKTHKAKSTAAPWFSLPALEKPKTAIIIGAGLAGCSTAEALARRGIKVLIIDQQASICAEASGNRQGVMYAKLPTLPTLAGELHLCGLEYTLRLLNIYDCLNNKVASQCGVLQLATSVKEAQRQHSTIAQGHYSSQVVNLICPEEASAIAGSKIEHQALHFPRAGWVYPKGFCEALIQHEQIKLKLSTTVTTLTQKTDKRWCVTDQNRQEHSADIVIVASAAQAKNFDQLNHLPIKPIRGQVSSVAAAPASALSNSTSQTTFSKTTSSEKADSITSGSEQHIKTVVCGKGYICPSVDGIYSFGATFDLHDLSPELREADHERNLTVLSHAVPDFARTLPPIEQWQGKVGYRCSTADYLPIAGPAPNINEYNRRYAKLKKDRKWAFDDQAAPLHSGLYVNLGHGSKGLITAPIAAEYLASTLCGEPSPLPQDISYALHPARFIIKSLIRSQE